MKLKRIQVKLINLNDEHKRGHKYEYKNTNQQLNIYLFSFYIFIHFFLIIKKNCIIIILRVFIGIAQHWMRNASTICIKQKNLFLYWPHHHHHLDYLYSVSWRNMYVTLCITYVFKVKIQIDQTFVRLFWI